MADITLNIDIPKPCKINAPVYDHRPHGWYAPNSIHIKHCVPTYTNSGGGMLDKELVSFEEAAIKSIAILKTRIYEAEALICNLEKLKEINSRGFEL